MVLIFLLSFVNLLQSAELSFPCANSGEVIKKSCLDKACKFKAEKPVATGRAWLSSQNIKILLYTDQSGKIIFNDWKSFEDSTLILSSHCLELEELKNGLKTIQNSINLKYTNRMALIKKSNEKTLPATGCEEMIRLPFKNYVIEARGIKESCVPKK